MKKNDIFNAEITSYTSEGLGIARIDNMVVFIPNSAVGDVADIRITKVEKTYAYGKVEHLISPSPARIQNDCPAFPRCGGCDFRHISYEEELRFKRQRVEDVLHRITGIELSPEEIIGADNIYSYRNKAQFPVKLCNGSVELGFYRERSHDIIPVNSCHIQQEKCAEIISSLKKWMTKYGILPYDEITHKGIVRHLYTRGCSKTEEMLVCIVSTADKLPNADKLIDELIKIKGICGIIHCTNKSTGNRVLGEKYSTLWGNDYIYDYIGNLKFKVSVQSFFQINTEQVFKLYSKAKEYAQLTGTENVIDLYCGTGSIGLFMADKANSVFGMEIIPEAIRDAKINAELNGIKNSKFITGDATALTPNALPHIENNVIFVDPPRKGLTNELIDTICSLSPIKVVYISCDPATMARDLKQFIVNGYEPVKCAAVDMFPRTRHVESVVCHKRK